MLIEGVISSYKTNKLIDEYVRLLNSGVDSSKVLVLLQNSCCKSEFLNKVLPKLEINVSEKFEIHSFYGLVYNTVLANWAAVETLISDANPTIIPHLVGLEVSQFILKEILQDIKVEGYNSKKSLLHQIFRRYSLIIQNNLSEEDVNWRSDIVLNEPFGADAKKIHKTLLSKTLHLRGLDYLRQCLIFNYIYKNTDAFAQIEYLLVDDADEISPICFDFIKHLSPQLKDAYIAYDSLGSSRSGYLSADKNVFRKLENLFKHDKTVLPPQNALYQDAQTLYGNLINDETTKLSNFSLISLSKRAQMLDDALGKINDLIKSGIKPCEISVVTPVIDDMLKFCIKENIKQHITKPLFLSGSEKLIQNKLVLASVNILKLNCNLKNELSSFDLRVILSDFLKIPLKYCQKILDYFDETHEILETELGIEEYNLNYKKFLETLKILSSKKMKLSAQVLLIYENLAQLRTSNVNEINKFNFFVKQLQDFESVFKSEAYENQDEKIINQVENSIIAENPYSVLKISEENLVIATPQKIIDNKVQTKYQIWIDVSSGEWIKTDTGPMYNAWVFQADWDKEEYTFDDDEGLSREKTARVLRKLTLCAKESIFAFSSLFDANGVENFGGIEKYLSHTTASTETTEKIKPIIPRDDQKPVLDYKSGNMAISAVPGAGKTTILLALILKIMDNGANPENIFVLTYMESAARNFRERIKNIRPQNAQLPNISTIHGLALKIIKDGSNFERLGLPSDFEICDEARRNRIISDIAKTLKLKKTEIDEFDRAISAIKLGEGVLDKSTSDKKLAKFIEFYEAYQLSMSSNNLVDYDDMLISSVSLLEKHPDILAHYQELCQYIIEDEAQDSSAVQQRLIGLLSKKHQNLIRCGDINQAITTTFSNADVEGFRKFIETSHNVKMDCSQRCCEDVWKLANALVEQSDDCEYTQNAFFKQYMRPVDGKNPTETNAINAQIFENTTAEKNFVLKEIKKLFDKNESATIGILLRNNYQVAEWTKFINDAGFKSITRSECLEQKGVFRTIFAVLQMINEPFNNDVIANSYETLAEYGFYAPRLHSAIRNYETPFVQMCADDIENPYLTQFYWDLTYWLSFSSISADELAIKIGLHYYRGEIEKSNVYLISTLIKRISSGGDFTYIVEKLQELSKKPSLSGFKFFSEEDESNREFLSGKVQIMTLHKSKGDEFDYVFLPEMAEKNLTIDFEQIKVKSSTSFMEQVKAFNPNYKLKSEYDLKKELVEENLRLLYVAITRAKRKLYITVAEKTKSFSKEISQEPSMIFSSLLYNTVESKNESECIC